MTSINDCIHEEKIFNGGFIVCTNCGLTFGRQYDQSQFTEDYVYEAQETLHSPRSLGTQKERFITKKWDKLNKLNNMHLGNYPKKMRDKIKNLLHEYLVFFHIPLKLELNYFNYAWKIWRKIPAKKYIRRLKNYIPAIFGYISNNLQIDVGNEEICNFAKIEIENYLSNLTYLYLEINK